MKKLFAIILFALITVQVYCQEKEAKNFTSYWEGNLKISAISLKIVLKIFKNEDGTSGAFLDRSERNKYFSRFNNINKRQFEI
ncbi:MAG: hypothetical protein M1495_13110 [Bacteroidetes bacterium]|nr:hypothetical protein [Bacteroidota bacterium]MCL6100725.1 hypothetical protein [Bacteroidota bacterium]